MRKLITQGKGNLLDKGKAAHTQETQNKEFINYFPLAGRYSAITRKAEL